MTYREALDSNRRCYRSMMYKYRVYTDSPRTRTRKQPGSYTVNGENGSKNLVNIFIPGGTVLNLLNVIELSSPSGISLKASLPLKNEDVKDFVGAMINKVVSSSGQSDGFISITRVDDMAKPKG